MNSQKEYETLSFLMIQNLIKDKVSKNEKFFIGRLSGNETNLTGKVFTQSPINHGLMHEMLYTAGIQFKSNEDIIEYVKLYDNAVSKTTLIATWDGVMRSQCIEYYNYMHVKYPDITRVSAIALEPFYYFNNSKYEYDKLFENKRVLIITSQKETTLQQLAKLDSCYPDKKIFHKTTSFHVYKPCQQNGGSHDENAWHFHYNKMKEDLKKIKESEFDFDVAFVSCGGFGMILSEYIYSELNTSTIYVGGGLQLYFGILGKRWSSNETINRIKNNSWVFPVKEDMPKNSVSCEGGCYW